MIQEHPYLNDDDVIYGIPAKRYQAAIQGWIEAHDYDGQSDQSRHDDDCELNYNIAGKYWSEQECMDFLEKYEELGYKVQERWALFDAQRKDENKDHGIFW